MVPPPIVVVRPAYRVYSSTMKSTQNDASILVYLPAAVKHQVRIAAAIDNMDMSSYVVSTVVKDLKEKGLSSEPRSVPRADQS